MKKICFITTSRADFGTLDELIQKAVERKFFFVQIIISGSHISKIFGSTEKEIKNRENCMIVKVKIKCQNNNPKTVTSSIDPEVFSPPPI